MISKYPKITGTNVEILELYANQDDPYGAEFWGYQAYGHWDKQSFAIGCNIDFDLACMESPVYTCEVEHEYDEDGARITVACK